LADTGKFGPDTMPFGSYNTLVIQPFQVSLSPIAPNITRLFKNNDIDRRCKRVFICILTIGLPILVYLVEMTSSNLSSIQLAKNNLGLCLLALNKMQKAYFSANAAYKLFDRARTMVEKRLREAEVVSRDPTVSPETQGLETAQWLDDSEDYDFASTGMLSASWTPFANFIPDDSFRNSF
ncbi:hypothetical protein FOC4_g10000976, partial [Fusarium odoratissimum]